MQAALTYLEPRITWSRQIAVGCQVIKAAETVSEVVLNRLTTQQFVNDSYDIAIVRSSKYRINFRHLI